MLNRYIYTQCAKDCDPHNRECEYRRARLHGSQSLAHVVAIVDRSQRSFMLISRQQKNGGQFGQVVTIKSWSGLSVPI